MLPAPSPPTVHHTPVFRPGFLSGVWSRWADLLALSFLLGLALLLLSRQIALGGAIYDNDMMLMSLPVFSWYADRLKEGLLPLWSPDVMGGAPLAFVIYPFFYPPDILLYWLLDAPRAFHLSLALHLALAGMATFWYCRVLGMRRLPSLLAAVAFQMGDVVLEWQSNGFVTRSFFLLPALWAVVELSFRKSSRYWLLVPLIVGSALLGGYAQVVLFGLATAAVYALVCAAVSWRDARVGRLPARDGPPGDAPPGRLYGAARPLLLLGLGVALGFGLAAVRVAPTLAVVAQSSRGEGMDLARSAVDSIEPWALVMGYLLPAVAELPGRTENRPDYVGIPVLLLAALAVGAFHRLDRVGRFHLGLACVAMVLSLGAYTPAYGLLLQVPLFSLFRGPDRLSPVAALAMAVLAAYALDRRLALEVAPGSKRYWAAVASAVAAILIAFAALMLSLAFRFGGDPVSTVVRGSALEGGWYVLNALRLRVAIPVLGLIVGPLLLVACARSWISHRGLERLALASTVATLFLLGWLQNLWMAPSVFHEPPALVKLLAGDSDRYRIFSRFPGTGVYNAVEFWRRVGGRPPSREFEASFFREFVPPNLGMQFGIATAEWYDALQTRRQALLASYMGSERAEPAVYEDGSPLDWNLRKLGLHERLNLLAALNVKYLTHGFAIQDPRLEPIGETLVQIYPDAPPAAEVRFYRLTTAMPRAFLVPQSVVMPREREVLEALMAGSVDLHQRVILEQAPPPLPGASLSVGSSLVQILEYRDDRVVLGARTDGSGYLVLMDFLLPGWSATVDGHPEPILAANFAGRAVPLQGPGEHEVVFSYHPPLFREGLLLSLASLVLLISISLFGRGREPKQQDTKRQGGEPASKMAGWHS